jgi:hypothetical protein
VSDGTDHHLPVRALVVETSLALETISRSPWTAIVLSFDGQIAEVVPFASEPTAETFLEFTRAHARGRKFRLMRQATLTAAQLDAVVADVMRSDTARRTGTDGGPRLPEDKLFWSPLSGTRALSAVIAALIARRWR